MNEKAKARREAYEAKQEKKARKVVNGIFIALVALAVLYAAFSVWLVS